MERAALVRSLSCSSAACNRLFFRFAQRPLRPLSPLFSSSSSSSFVLRKQQCLLPNPGRRSTLRHKWRLISSSPSSFHPKRCFSSLSPRAVTTSPKDASPDFVGSQDAVAEKLGFEKISEQVIDECKARAVLYKHKKTGAEVMSVSNDDENKVFGIVFRTPPKDSTGIPHILEHSVLCGSRKYPLKEPFVELLKGSLNTFLNAFTYPDRTCYPVASTNSKDFYNLVDVYLDAVFFPKCVDDLQIFQQEGWHYELDSPSEEISFKGVVFNEMKGVYSQPDNILGRRAQEALFPDNTYGVDSGGDPKVIPKLTFEEFKEFHRKYYHPSNSRIWFYGDDDPIERLRILSVYLDMFDASSAPNESKVEPQKLLSEPVRIIEKYPAGEGGDLKKKHMVCINWLLSDKTLDFETELTLGFLDHLMLGTPASPLRRILLESGLGDAIVGGGVEDELLQPQFSIGLKGVSKDDIQKVEELVMSTLKNLAEEGFDPEAVEASMNTIEFSLRENNTGSFPRGLSLMLRSIGKWIYDMDPFEPLKYEKPLMALKERIAEKGSKAVFSPLIEKFILNNPHRVTIEMQPDPEKASQDESAEREILEKVKASMTEEDLAELARATQELRLKQETPDPPEALRSVPSLSLQDIPKKPIHVPTEVGEINEVKVLQHDLFTNDVIYTEVVLDMSSLKQELLPLVPLFCQSLLEMGTKDMDFVQLNRLIGRKTGGISVYPFTSSIRDQKYPCSHIIVRGKAMAGRTEDLHKDRRVSSESPRAPPVHSKKKDEIGSDGVLALKERKQCTHFDKGVDLTKLSSKIGSLESVRCEDCREGALDRKASKGRSKHGKKKSLSSTDAKSIWVCLECGHFACGGVGLPTTPQTHAVRHARQTSHPCVIQFDNPHLRWCYPCNSLIPIEKSEDNNEQKDLLLDAVKLIRGRSSEGASTDVGDVWSEGGSVGTEMKSESVEPTDLGGEGGYVVRGLLNLGNTCFFNSVMQNLLAMKSLRDYFMKMDSSVGPVTMALKKLFIETSPGMESRNVINPRTLFGCICANAPQFKGYQQQDSHELLCYLLDGLCTEELGERKLLQSSNEGHPSNPFDTFVDFIFGGQLSSTVCCKECGHSSTVYEPFLDLSLPVPTKKPPSKKVHPVPRTRKPKLPPKKGGKARMKGNSDATPRAIGPSESFESSSQVLSSVPVANEMLAQQGNNVWLDSIRPSSAVGDNCSVSQNCSVSAIHDSENKQDFQSVADQAVASVNDFSWLDYIEPGIGSDNHLCISQNNDATVIQDSINNQFIMNDHVLQDCSEQCSQISLPHRERNMELCSSLANCEDELPLQVQDSEVLLLPYKEENVTANEMVKEEGEASSSIVVCQQDSLDFDGFGDLFNEPDMVSVPTTKPLLGDKDIEPNEITEKGFSLRNSSDSDPEEVDNTNAPVSIDSCLAYFTRPELLADEHAWHCDSCSKSLQNQNVEARNIRLETKSKTQRNGGVRRHNIPSGLNGDFPCSEELKRLVNKKTESDTVFTATAESLASQSVQFDDSNQNVPKNCQNCMGTKLLAPTSNQVDYADVSQCGKDLDELNHASQEQSSSSSDYLSCSQASFCDQVSDSCSVNEPNSIGCKLDQVQPRDSQFPDRASKYDDNEDVEMDSESVKVKRDATKRILISKAPPILTIHLKRFSQDSRGRLSKLSGHVDFKDTIDLKPYTVLRNREGDKCDYRLVGVVEHSGTMRRGHYVAYIRGKKFKGNNGNDDGDSTWYYVSDTHVRETSLEEVLHCEAYILFYERI